MTPTAARGLFEAILWKPAIRWYVVRIHVLNPIAFITLRRNEVDKKAVAPPASVIANGGPPPALLIEDSRVQRNTVALRDVDYVVEAQFELTDQAGSEDNVTKFVEMFQRRLAKGQRFHQPYFGCREFVAHVEPAPEKFQPIPVTKDLGRMLYEIEYNGASKKCFRPMFFSAHLNQGTLCTPWLEKFAAGKEIYS
jgi:CRISPR-associated protein Cas5d